MFQVEELAIMRIQLQRVEMRSEDRHNEVERLRIEAVQLLADVQACRSREAESLEFTHKLTDKNVKLQVSTLNPGCYTLHVISSVVAWW